MLREYLFLELLFYVGLTIRKRWWRVVDYGKDNFPPPPTARILQLAEDYMSSSAENATSFLSGWFFGSMPRLADANAFFAWACYCRRWEALAAGERAAIAAMLERVERRVT